MTFLINLLKHVLLIFLIQMVQHRHNYGIAIELKSLYGNNDNTVPLKLQQEGGLSNSNFKPNNFVCVCTCMQVRVSVFTCGHTLTYSCFDVLHVTAFISRSGRDVNKI